MRRHALALALFALLLGTGSTVGDVGGCGADAVDLDETRFALARKRLDCARCTSCSLKTARCTMACDLRKPSDVGFPPNCKPLLHDGEVCLHALQVASCSDYAFYVDDQTRAVPIECEFCRGDASEPPPVLGDSGR